MAVNLHSKYSNKIEQQFVLQSVIAGKSSDKYNFDGVETIHATSIVTEELGDYSRENGLSTQTRVQDWIQDFKLDELKDFNKAIDDVDASDASGTKAAGPVMAAIVDERAVPYFDKKALFFWGYNAGNSVVQSAASTKDTIVGMVNKAKVAFTNAHVPNGNRYIGFVSTEYVKVLDSPSFIAADTGVGRIAENGVVGMISGFKVVEIPDDYLPTSCLFVAWHKESVMAPVKLKELRIISPEGRFGKALQGLFYGGKFVVGPKAGGVYAALANGSSVKVAKPTATQGGAGAKNQYTLASGTAGSTIKYTLDGTDPRYSKTAVSVATGTVITLAAAVTDAKFVAIKADMFVSDVLTQTCPIT